MNEGTRHLTELHNKAEGQLRDLENLDEKEIRCRLACCDRARHLAGIFERNRQAIEAMEGQLRSHLTRVPQFPKRAPGWE